MYDRRKSDSPIVPAKLPNKPGETRGRRWWREGGCPRGTRPGKHVPDSEPEITCQANWIVCGGPPGRVVWTPEPEGGAQCVRRARWDLRGGPPATTVPTAIELQAGIGRLDRGPAAVDQPWASTTRRATRARPTPSIVTGGLGFVADLDTLSFVKHRQTGERHVFYVTFAADHPRLGLLEMKYAYRVEPPPDGGGAHSAVQRRRHPLRPRDPTRGEPGRRRLAQPLLRRRGDLPRRRGYLPRPGRPPGVGIG
jgi:hypothetical protein